MKRFLIMFAVVFSVLALAACGKKEYAYDGKFTAFKADLNYGAPQLTWVEVTVEKGKVTKFYIDALQTKDGVWNAKTKKELKEEYGMKETSEIGKEWYEQAEVIEAFFLSDGPDKLKLDKDGYIDGLAGATVIGSTYKELALDALDNAKKGIYTAFLADLNYGAPQLTWVNVTYEGKKVKSFYIDALQTKDGVWNAKTKKELKEEYGMKAVSEIGKEWYEQAEVIEAFFLSDGPDKLKLDKDGYIDGLAGATVIGTTYKNLAIKALGYKK